MQAVILAAGLGERMRPLTDKMPKPLIPVNGKPFLFYLMKNLQKADFNDFVIVANYKIEMIREFLKQYEFSATVVDQKEPLGTAHAIASAESLIKGNFVVVMSDSLYSPEDLRKFRINDGINYVGGHVHKNPEKYGNLLINGDFLERIVEKPAQKVSDFVNTGLYKFTPDIFSAIRKIGKSERGEYTITDAISLLCRERNVKAIGLKNYWFNMGKPEDIPVIEEFLKSQSGIPEKTGIDKNIFRAYDIRGIYGKNLTENIMERIGFGVGKDNPGKDFLVGNDIRESGKELAYALIKGLDAAGADVSYSGTTSFGQTLFAGWRLKKYATLFVTASHLPPEWNGLKLYYGDGEPFSEGQIMGIRDMVAENNEKTGYKTKNDFKEIDITEDYSLFIIDKFSKLKGNGLKVVLDCGNGSMCLAAPEIFRSLDFDVVDMYCNVDSNFPNRESELTVKSTEALRKKVVEEKADFGVAFDGDGDRCIIIDDEGRFLTGNEIGIIIGRDIFGKTKGHGRKAVITVACSRGVKKELKDLGADIVETPVGHTHVISNCKKHNALFGIEESGHIVMPQYFWFDDAILIPLKIAEIIFERGRKLSQAANDIKTCPFDEVVFPCDDNLKFGVMKNLKEKLRKKYKNAIMIDGIKLEFDDSWILIRVSNTSPKIRLYVEAENGRMLKKLKDEFSGILAEEIDRCNNA
ncbi:MAG: sugar phosphate nucleotidyltransferase [Candidatus Aenigmatarchaeota archaeon]